MAGKDPVDGFNPAAGDSNAIAIDKTALRPGGQADFGNYTSFSRGLNGVMVDIRNLAYDENLSARDFEFRVGNDSDPSTWPEEPKLASVTVEERVSDTHRVTIVWANHDVENQWLEVTVKVNEVTGLAADDVFYFGNAVGETGTFATDALVDFIDEVLTRTNPHYILASALIDDDFDFNRDGIVNAIDQVLVRSHRTDFGSALQLVGVPDAVVANVPEPATGMILAAAVTSILLGCGQRRSHGRALPSWRSCR